MATVTYTPPSTAIIHQVEVDMITRRIITNPIHLVQYDDRLPILEVSLFNGDTVYTCPSNAEVSVRYEKPDSKVVYNPVLGWNSARTKIYVQVSVQMTTAFGEANAILEIKSGGFTAGSANFPVLVERNPVQEGAIISTDEMIQLQAYVQSAANYANRSAESATASASSANTSKTEANRAQSEATKAASSASDSAAARNAAQVSATTASNEATRSQTEATKAETQAGKSKDYSNLSQSYAEGTGNVVRPNDATNNSKFYSELARTLTEEAEKLLDQAQKIVAAATTGALIPSGTIPFEDLPEEPIVGYMYNISNDFTTDDRFADGPGIFYRAGTNVYWSNDEEWDIMVGVQVTGVKGSKESSYRVGNVNLSPDDIGAVPVAGDISQNIVPFTTAEELSNLETRDSMDVAFGKLAKMYDILDQSAGFYPVSTSEVINKVGTLMDGKTVSDLFSKLNGNINDINPIKNYADNVDVKTYIKSLIDSGEGNGVVLFSNSTGLPDNLSAGTISYISPKGTLWVYLKLMNIGIKNIVYFGRFSRNSNEAIIWDKGVLTSDLLPVTYTVPEPTGLPNFIFSTFGCVAYKSGNTVTLRLNIIGTMNASASFIALFNLPEFYRPIISLFSTYIAANGMPMQLSLNTNGIFSLYNGNKTITNSDFCKQVITYQTN